MANKIPKQIRYEVINENQFRKILSKYHCVLKFDKNNPKEFGKITANVFNPSEGNTQEAYSTFRMGLYACPFLESSKPIGHSVPVKIRRAMHRFCRYTKFRAANHTQRTTIKHVFKEAKLLKLSIEGPSHNNFFHCSEYKLNPKSGHYYIDISTDGHGSASVLANTHITPKRFKSFWHPFKGKIEYIEKPYKMPNYIVKKVNNWDHALTANQIYRKENKYERRL